MVRVVANYEERVKAARHKSWLCMGLAVFSLFFNLLFVLTMYQMGSRVTVMTQLFNTTRGTNTLVLSDILNFNLGNLELIQKAFVRRFIEERNFQIPAQKEMERRWGPLGTLAMISHPVTVWRPVYRYDDQRVKDVVDQLPRHADNIEIVSHVGNSWLVDFDLWTHLPQGSVKERKRASLLLAFYQERMQRVATPGYYYNPLGMTVVDYSIVPTYQ